MAETDFHGAVTRYAYDPAGQLTSRVNAVGQEVTFGYDELGRLVRRVADGAVSTFSYDAAGRLVRAANPDAEIRFTRDPLGRVTAETCDARTVLSSYDTAGRRTRRVTPGGARQRWKYDAAGRPVLLAAGGHTLAFGYDGAGREIRRELSGGAALTQDWNTTGQLTRQLLTATPTSADGPAGAALASAGARAATPWTGPARDGSVLARRAYTYRADGCLAIVDDLLAGSRRFTLDDQSRITAVTGDRWAEHYRYDPAGNLASARWSAPPPGAASTWLTADLQGPRDRTGTLVTRAGAVRYRHDRQGRVIQRQRARSAGKPTTWSYQWDADDRLTAVTTPDGSTWWYRYDPLGRRIGLMSCVPRDASFPDNATVVRGGVCTPERLREGHFTAW